jgi:hypothetical protein
LSATALELLGALIGAEFGALQLALAVPSDDRVSAEVVSSAAPTSSKSCSSGAYILASTSLSSVNCRTSSLGSAVSVSAKKVVAGKMSMGWSLAGSCLPAAGRAGLAELRGGFVRVCRRGCDLRCDEASADGALADFMAIDEEG